VNWARIFYDHIDRSLQRPVFAAGDRDTMSDGEWKQAVGNSGEKLAAKFLRREGLKVLYRNFRAPKGGEVDIVCRDGECLVFTEVKTRTSSDYGNLGRAVDRKKQTLITKGAMAWLRALNFPEVIFRFDVVEVILEPGESPRIEHLRNVFEMPAGYRY
jgi:putative endonuclease